MEREIMTIDFTYIIKDIENIGFIGFILIWMSFLIGFKFPDWDFKLKFKHRNILTHSPLILWIMIYFYKTQKGVEIFRYSIVGFALAIGIHMIYDFFPKGWSRGALIYVPWCNLCLKVKGSRCFIFFTLTYSLYLAVRYCSSYIEFLILMIFSIYILLKNIKKEEKFFRPFFLFICIFILFGMIKYREIQSIIEFSVCYMLDKLGIIFKM